MHLFALGISFGPGDLLLARGNLHLAFKSGDQCTISPARGNCKMILIERQTPSSVDNFLWQLGGKSYVAGAAPTFRWDTISLTFPGGVGTVNTGGSDYALAADLTTIQISGSGSFGGGVAPTGGGTWATNLPRDAKDRRSRHRG